MKSTLKVFQSVTAVNILCNSTRPTTHLTTGQVGGGDRGSLTSRSHAQPAVWKNRHCFIIRNAFCLLSSEENG